MDPRIGWYPNELVGQACSTWSTIWMWSQMANSNSANNLVTACGNSGSNSSSLLTTNKPIGTGTGIGVYHSTPNLNPSPVGGVPPSASNNNNSSANLTSNATTQHHQPLQIQIYNDHLHHPHHLVPIQSSPAFSRFDMNPESNLSAILRGLKNRKSNKASTFGFNFPMNQYMLDDPMSTPWMLYMDNKQPSQSQQQTESIKIASSAPTAINTPLASSSQGDCLLSTSVSSLSSPSASPSSSVTSSSYQNNQFGELFQSSSVSSSGKQLDECIDEYSSSVSSEALDFNTNYVSEGLVNLHKEILLFSAYIAPTPEEMFMREEIIGRIKKVIKDHFPFAQVDIFGSYKTGRISLSEI